MVQRCGRKAIVTLTVVLAATALAASAAQASPARYIYEQCDSILPGGGSAGVTFPANLGGPYSPANRCADPGGGLTISQTATSYGSFSYWNVPSGAPAGGHTESITLSATVCTQGDSAVLAYAFQQPWLGACSEETRTFRAESSLDLGFLVWLGCNSRIVSCPPGPSIAAHYFATTMVDPVAPSVAGLGGGLFGAGVLRGHQTVSAIGHDRGGGVSSVSIQVNGLLAAKPKTGNCQLARANNSSVIGVVATVITPCPSDVNASWTLDTSAYPFHNGANTVAICASDFATLGDPNTTCSPARTINVDNSCTNSPVPGGESLSAQFATSRREETTVPFGRSAKITGRLSNSAGDAIPGATICLQTQTLDNHRSLVPLATVTTDAHGRFSYDLRPGPNRRILIGYRYDTFQIDRSVRYYSRAEPTLKATPRKLENGKRIHLQGRLPGPGADGRVVVLQANVVGSRRWITFRRATSARKGIFRATYHFTATTQTTTYRFRAVVPNQTGYPWVEGASKPVKVRVTG